MKIPIGPSGLPTLSATQLRTYGAGGFVLEEQEEDKGCPRKYFGWYEAGWPRGQEAPPYELAYGSMFHEVLYHVEEDGLEPFESLEKHFDPTLGLDAMEEARRDLERYLERESTPRDRFATLAVEVELDGLLFDDPEYGQVMFRARLDWIGLDPEQPNVIHVVDFKTNRSPFRNDDIRGDVQIRGQHWVVAQNIRKYVPKGPFRIVMHLDAIKFREVEFSFTDAEIDDWEAWATAVARAILQDEEHKPIINTYCPRCPFRGDCPAYLSLPQTGTDLTAAAKALQTDEERVEWRDEANKVRLVLEKAVKSVDDELKSRAKASPDPVVIGGWVWQVENDTKPWIDLRRLHELLRDRFYDLVGTSKTAIAEFLKDEPELKQAALGTVEQIVVGTKVERRKVEKG